MIYRPLLYLAVMLCCFLSTARADKANERIENMHIRLFPSLDMVILSCSIFTEDWMRRNHALRFDGANVQADDGTAKYFEKTYSFEEFKAGEYKCKIDTAEATFTLKNAPDMKAMNDKDIVEMSILINGYERSALIEFEAASEKVDFLCKTDGFPMKLNSSNQLGGIMNKGFIEYITEPNSISCSAYEPASLLDFNINYEDVFPNIQDFAVHIVSTPEGPRIRTTCAPVDILKGKVPPADNLVQLYHGNNLKESINGTASYGLQLAKNMLFKCNYKNKYDYDLVAFELNLNNFNYESAKSKLAKQESGQISFFVKMLERTVYVHNMKSQNNAASITCKHNDKQMMASPEIIYGNDNHQLYYADLWLDNRITCNNIFGQSAQFFFIKKGLRPIITELSMEVDGFTSKISCKAHHRLIDYTIKLYNLEWREPWVKTEKNRDIWHEANYASDKWRCVVETQTGKDEVVMRATRGHVNDAPGVAYDYDHDFEARIDEPSINPGWYVQQYVYSSRELSKGYFCMKNEEYNPNFNDDLTPMNYRVPELTKKYRYPVKCYSREKSGYSFNFVRESVKLT